MMQFKKVYEKINLINNEILIDILYNADPTKEQLEMINSYEVKKYEFEVKSTIYSKIKIYEQKNKNYNNIFVSFPQLKQYHNSKKIKQIKIIFNLIQPFFIKSLLKHKIISPSSYNFELISFSILIKKNINKKNTLIPFANKSHTKKNVYAIDTDLCQICTYNDDAGYVIANGIKTIENAIALRLFINGLN